MKRLIHCAALALGATLFYASPLLADLTEDLATADIKAGEKVFRKCKACHTADPDGRNMTGPNLYGIVGRKVAAVEGFSYSSAMAEYGGEWTPERLDAYLTKPRAVVKGTKMSFAGLPKDKDRINLIAYLNTQSDTPLPFGATQEAGTHDTSEADQADENEFGLLKNAPGVETTFYSCTACHSEMIIAQQGLSRANWDDLLDWMIEEQGMNEPDAQERTEILDYLAEHYNEDRPNFPRR